MAITLSCKYQSLANPLDDGKRMNEDSLFIDMDTGIKRFVLSDGAGGSGVFSKDWSDCLVKAVPADPLYFLDNYAEWLNQVSEKFYQYIEKEKDLSDPVLNAKFFKQGSYATLISVWVDEILQKIYMAGVGDSFVFLFGNVNGEVQLQSIFPANDLNNLDQSPALINWGDQNIVFPSQDEIDLHGDFICVLASDSLAKWMVLYLDRIDPLMLERIGVNGSFRESCNNEKYRQRKEWMGLNSNIRSTDQLIRNLDEMLESTDAFFNATVDLLVMGEIDQDDFSIILIKGYVSN